MFVKSIDHLYLESYGIAIIRDRSGWYLTSIQNQEKTRKTLADLMLTGEIENDQHYYDYVHQPAKVIESPGINGKQILDIFMRWEL